MALLRLWGGSAAASVVVLAREAKVGGRATKQPLPNFPFTFLGARRRLDERRSGAGGGAGPAGAQGALQLCDVVAVLTGSQASDRACLYLNVCGFVCVCVYTYLVLLASPLLVVVEDVFADVLPALLLRRELLMDPSSPELVSATSLVPHCHCHEDRCTHTYTYTYTLASSQGAAKVNFWTVLVIIAVSRSR